MGGTIEDEKIFSLEPDLGFGGYSGRLFHLPVHVAVLLAQEADQVGMQPEGGSRAAVLASRNAGSKGIRVNDLPAFDAHLTTFIRAPW